MPDIFTYFRPYDARNYRRTQSSQKTPNKNTSKQGDGSTNENVNSLQNFGIRPRTNTGLTFNLFRPASLNGTYPDLDNVGVHPRTDTGLTLNLFRPAPLQGTYPDLDNFGIHPNNKIGLSLDKYRQTGDDVEYESQTPKSSSQKITTSNTNNSNVSKPVVQTKKGDTVASIWTRVTGLPWKAAKELGLSDGSYAANIEILKGLKSGQITKESIAALQEAQSATPYEQAPETYSMSMQPTIERPSLPSTDDDTNEFANGGILGWDPTLKKRYPQEGPEAIIAYNYWKMTHSDREPYPQTFRDRLNAYIDEQKLQQQANALQRKKKIQASGLYRKLNQIDNDYLNNLFVHPDYERNMNSPEGDTYRKMHP